MSQSSRSTVRSSLVVALGGFLLGFDSAVVSGVMDPVKDAFGLNSDQVGFTASCLILGAMVGNALAGPLANRFGRRAVLIATADVDARELEEKLQAREVAFAGRPH